MRAAAKGTECKWDVNVARLQGAVPVVHGVGGVGEGLGGRDVGVGPVRFGRGGRRGRGMMERGHRGATGGRHWAGGLHSCMLLLLIGTAAKTNTRVKDQTRPLPRLRV